MPRMMPQRPAADGFMRLLDGAPAQARRCSRAAPDTGQTGRDCRTCGHGESHVLSPGRLTYGRRTTPMYPTADQLAKSGCDSGGSEAIGWSLSDQRVHG